MPTKDLTFAMVGSGGDGVVTMGDLVAQAAAREGLHAVKTEAYGPQIRGGEASCTVRVAGKPILAQGSTVDVLVVFRWSDFTRFKGEISVGEDAFILAEADDVTTAEIDLGGSGPSRCPSRSSLGTPRARPPRRTSWRSA